MTTIVDTDDMAEALYSAGEEAPEMSALKATTEPEGKGIEFHVSMHRYTMHDMEALIVEAAAQLIVGRYGDKELARQVEAKCLDLIHAKATAALAGVTNDIMDQPITPTFGDKKPVTVREFVGLLGREYLSERVDRDGKQYSSGGWGSGQSTTRTELLIAQYMQRHFKSEIEKATNAAIAEMQKAIRDQHAAFLAAEKKRLADALARASA